MIRRGHGSVYSGESRHPVAGLLSREDNVIAKSRARVLIVEDDADLAWVEQFNLESEGYEVAVALEGLSAIDALGSFAPDILVLDVMLPRVDGWAVLARARELPVQRRPKVIVVSAVAGLSEAGPIEELGVGSFLPKPFDMDELVRLVGEALQAA